MYYCLVVVTYDCVLVVRLDYGGDADWLIELCVERNVAMQTIKSIARGRWSGSREGKFSWYEPLRDAAAIGRGVRYILGSEHPLFLNTSSDATLLPTILEAAAGDLTAPTADELRADIDTYGITSLFDGADLERI